MAYFNPEIETLDRGDLDALVDERISNTVRYAAEHSLFYRRMFEKTGIDPNSIREHEDLLELPVISGKTIRENQPPVTGGFGFLSVDWKNVYTIHETSGTSGTPKAFFLTWSDWQRYAEKYARCFVSQGFGPDDRVVVCASYGMNVGANTMTLAARNVGFSVIPEGKCTFPPRVITSFRPTAIVGSVFKLLRLARRLKDMGIDPETSGISRLIVGGESFAAESRAYLAEVWGVDVYNTYGSTEGTMCGECTDISGLHVPEDLVHMDLYDPGAHGFVHDGECGRIVLTTLVPVGEKAGMVLINYDTEDTTVVLSRERCACGRTHMKILNPQREAETFWVSGVPVNRVDIERGVFSRDNMEYLTGEFEAFLYGGGEEGGTTLRVSVECEKPDECDREMVEETYLKSFFAGKPPLLDQYRDGAFEVVFHFTGPGGLELHRAKGRPKRFVDRR
jgi:coenzyme F390 synthetase